MTWSALIPSGSTNRPLIAPRRGKSLPQEVHMVPDHARWQRLTEVAGLFLKLGVTAFGGPAAHIAMMRHEVVRRRAWLDDQRFLDLLGATNLIPGPNSTEMAIHLGFLRAGWWGLAGRRGV